MANCFVVQGFGKKTDFTDGRVLDLDASYAIIKEAVESAGLACIRADEIAHSGSIDVPMYRQLLSADLVIADLSTYNVNAAFELGVRYALRPRATIIVAEEGLKNPFDVGHIVIRRYKHLGEDIGVKEAKRFADDLRQAITEILATGAIDSPVYTFLPDLIPPRADAGGPLPAALPVAAPTALGLARADAAAELAVPFSFDEAMAGTAGLALPIVQPAPVPAGSTSVAPGSPLPAADSAAPQPAPPVATSAKAMLDDAQARLRAGEFSAACGLLEAVRAQRPNDSFVIQQLALATYKSKQPTAEAALKRANDILLALQPASTNDPETLGLLGAIHKRLWELKQQLPDLNESIAAYGRGFFLKQDYYNGINLAFLLDLRALISLQAGQRDDGITDATLARRIRREVISYTEALLDKDYPDEKRYWMVATLCEAAAGLGDRVAAEHWAGEARALKMADWMNESTQTQIATLLGLQADAAKLMAQPGAAGPSS
jgi:hypothetical protein